MGIGITLSNIGISICFLLGLIAIFKPEYTKGFVGISAIGKEGDSEIRATYGGFFVGLSLCAFATQSSDVFAAIGFAWIAAALVRLITLCLGAFSYKNLAGVIFEGVVGVFCLSVFIAQ